MEEVVQIYVHVENDENEVPNPRLAAFKRITLKPGAEQTVEMTIPRVAFTTVNETKGI